MSLFNEITKLPNGFDGEVRLFPLPNLVMFPHVLQPLHIFEPRYCALMEDALANDQLITMATLKPGWEDHYDDQPQIESSVCVGRVINHARLDDGKFNLLLLGLRRATIIRELPLVRTFRRAEVLVRDEIQASEKSREMVTLRRQLLDAFIHSVPTSGLIQQQIEQLLSQEIPLAVLTDMLSHTMSFPRETKLELLIETDVAKRARLLAQLIERQRDTPTKHKSESPFPFPPPFSDN